MGTGMGGVTERDRAWEEWDQEWRNREASVSGAVSRVRRTKSHMLVGGVSEYRGFYEVEGAN